MSDEIYNVRVTKYTTDLVLGVAEITRRTPKTVVIDKPRPDWEAFGWKRQIPLYEMCASEHAAWQRAAEILREQAHDAARTLARIQGLLAEAESHLQCADAPCVV